MLTNKRLTLIVSAFQGRETLAVNHANTEDLRHYLAIATSGDIIPSIGHYKGDTEKSFVVHLNDTIEAFNIYRHVIDHYNQECVVFASYEDAAIALWYDESAVKIGTHFIRGTGLGYTTVNGEDWIAA